MPNTREPPILSVSDLTTLLKAVVEETFPQVWVAGEISNLTRAGSGHLYFTLKDAEAQLKAVMWRSAAERVKFQLHDGLEVIASGPLEVYAPRGQYQIIVQQMQPQGLGALELALRQLQQKLDAEGLFDPARKRPLPRMPRRIALVTSPSGAAVRDLIQVITRRWPPAELIIVPVAVQGEHAAREIAEGLRRAALLPEVDVIITGRGGGSLEDLWCFNEEVVARAIAASPIPIVTAIGHEIDVTIADLIADRRVLTPSEAGELVVPLLSEIREFLSSTRQRLISALQQRSRQARMTLDGLAQRRCFTRPTDRLHDLAARLDDYETRLKQALAHQMNSAKHRLGGFASTLHALSPLAVLDRGYSLTRKLPSGEVLRSVSDLHVGDQISTRLSQGTITSVVESFEEAGD